MLIRARPFGSSLFGGSSSGRGLPGGSLFGRGLLGSGALFLRPHGFDARKRALRQIPRKSQGIERVVQLFLHSAHADNTSCRIFLPRDIHE